MEEKRNSPPPAIRSEAEQINNTLPPEIETREGNDRAQPLPETPATENKKTRLSKERVKEKLKGASAIPEEELPAGVDPSSKYYKGNLVNLPTGWLIELRPRTNEKYSGKSDQFFYERETGKQFRSLKAAWKHLETKTTPEVVESGEAVESIFNQTADNEPEKKVRKNAEQEKENYPWDQMKRKTKRKRGIQPFDHKSPPESVTWYLQLAEDEIWIPEVANAEKYREQWAHTFDAMNPIPDPDQVFSTAASGSRSEEGKNGDN